MQFTETNIQALFGNEAAESEAILRLKGYYVKNSTYEQVASDTPLRILVGHKGIGKSALISVAIAEASDRGDLTILIRPDDILKIASDQKPLLELIADWKEGLTKILTDRVFSVFGIDQGQGHLTVKGWSSQIIQFLVDSVSINEVKLSPLASHRNWEEGG